jgi:ATP-dependent Clp protease adaptor protein ClpS
MATFIILADKECFSEGTPAGYPFLRSGVPPMHMPPDCALPYFGTWDFGRAFSAQQVRASGGGGVALPDQDVEEEVSRDVPWNVVVHNDPVNLMSYVTKVFQKVFGFAFEKAERHMLEVHQKGRSIVWCGAREKAELYVQQLQGFLLLSTLEKSV